MLQTQCKLNEVGIMNLEKSYEMDPIWTGFNEVFREKMNKKVWEKVLYFQFFRIFCVPQTRVLACPFLVSTGMLCILYFHSVILVWFSMMKPE